MSKGAVFPLRAGAVIDRKYRLVRRIGEGAMGVVWQAVNEATHGEVALKLIVRPERELAHRLLHEAQACCAIRHKNVVQVYDVGETAAGDPFLVMELLLGETLADLLARRRRLEPKEAAAIARDVARALSAAHEKSIVHRDLKPANVFLHHAPGEPSPIVKVLDFGVSKSLLGGGGAQTAAGATIGSPCYMSPEQALSSAAIDGRSDVWSLGVLLFEMLAGVRPFDGEPMEVIRRVVTDPIPSLSHRVRRVPADLSALVMACLRRAPEERPWPTSEIAIRLDAFAQAGPAPEALDDERTRRIAPRAPAPVAVPPNRTSSPDGEPGATPLLRETMKLPDRCTQPLTPPTFSAIPAGEPGAPAQKTAPRKDPLAPPESRPRAFDHTGPLRFTGLVFAPPALRLAVAVALLLLAGWAIVSLVGIAWGSTSRSPPSSLRSGQLAPHWPARSGSLRISHAAHPGLHAEQPRVKHSHLPGGPECVSLPSPPVAPS